MELTSSADTIVVKKAAATNTTDPQCVVKFFEQSRLQGERMDVPDYQRTAVTGAAEVTVLSGPASNTAGRRVVDKLWLYNTDAIQHDFYIGHATGGTTYRLKRVILDAGMSAEYSDEA